MKNFSEKTRVENLKKFNNETYDLIVIGGGINGAGVARDAAMRGMKVALLEARDFASGTSSKSSKLIHGGIRYLENMEFKLVFEALSERTKLFEMAPHLVHPLRFMIPIYKSSRVGMFMMGLGMWLYDALSLFQAPELHERLNGADTLERMPSLEKRDILGSYVYSDAYMDDDRLVIETLRSAHELGADIVNYVKAVSFELSTENVGVKHVKCVDQKSGETYDLKGRHIVSTVGPWTDEVAKMMFHDWKNILRPTKGIHITLPKDRLPLSSAVVMGAEKGNRIVFGIPRHEMIIIGTTDTDYKDDPKNVSVTPEDINYLMKVTHEYFPGANLEPKDILASYAGVRPLVHDGSEEEGKTSREHTIMSDARGVTFVAGGKYTTYRLMCEQTVEASLKFFDFDEQMKFAKRDTAVPLNIYTSPASYDQAKLEAEEWVETYNIEPQDAQLLAERYGLEGREILQTYPQGLSYWEYEAAHAIDKTMCADLVDFYCRRTPLYLSQADHGMSVLDRVASVFRLKLHWTLAEEEAQKEKLKEFISTDLKWKETSKAIS